MQKGHFSVKGNDCAVKLIELVTREFKDCYRSEIISGVLFFIEDYSVMTNSDLMICIKIQKPVESNDSCDVEIICGGGGEGILSIRFGNESRRVKKIYRQIEEYFTPPSIGVTELILS